MKNTMTRKGGDRIVLNYLGRTYTFNNHNTLNLNQGVGGIMTRELIDISLEVMHRTGLILNDMPMKRVGKITLEVNPVGLIAVLMIIKKGHVSTDTLINELKTFDISKDILSIPIK